MGSSKCTHQQPSLCNPTALPDWQLSLLPLCHPQNFAKMQLSEIEDNIVSRRNRIFLLMEEVRRLRIQRRLKVKAPTQAPTLPLSPEMCPL